MEPRIGIIGSGYGGLIAALRLRQAGYDDIVILERADEVGGVWRDNTYPGAACDIPSPYYSVSDEPNPTWPRRFAPGPSIFDYLRDLADRHDLRRHVRFGADVLQAEYDDVTCTWTLTLADAESVVVDVLVPAVGQLSRPSLPKVPGIETFEGTAFHSAEWDHDVDLTGRTVAVIGTGASAVQFVPQVQKVAGRVVLLQRSAPYLLPRPDQAYGPAFTRLFTALPQALKVERYGWYAFTELLGVGLLHAPALGRVIEAISRRHMQRQTASVPGLFEKIWPDYPIGCKRVLFSGDYLPSLAQPNVEVVTDGIAEVTPTGIVTDSGERVDVDVIVYGTGFAATQILGPLQVVGRDGRRLDDVWNEGAHAYLGTTVPDMPNLFMMYGPNTNLAAGSVVAMLEAQAGYLVKAVRHLAQSGRALSVRPEVEQRYDEMLQRRLAGGVWTQCRNWYTLPNGRVPTNWPGTVSEFRARIAHFDVDDYEHHTASNASNASSRSTGNVR